MTILDVCQRAAIRLVRQKPTAFFSATSDPLALELSELVQDAALQIARAADWQALLVRKEIPSAVLGDGSGQIYFDLPDDFDRLPVDARIHSSAWVHYVFSPIRNVADWIFIQQTLSIGAPGYWMLQDNQLGIYPPMPANEKAIFYYLSKNFATDNAGTGKATFSADTDKFVLDEPLLILALVWRWRAQKKLDYAEDLENYERALSERVGKNKGQRPLTIGTPRMKTDVGIAFPGRIVG